MRYRLKSLSGLLAFDAAARHGSLTLAARELGRTQSAVSQQVKLLEDQIGVPLFVRRPREILLTAAGRKLAATLESALGDIDRSVADITRREEKNVIRLTVYHSFAIHWLIPRLQKFSLLHPEIDVRVNADDRVVDLVAEGYDLAVRIAWRMRPPDGVTALRHESFMPVYAPSLSPDRDLTKYDIGRFPLLGYNDGRYWRGWMAENEVAYDAPNFGKTYSHSGLLVQAAIVGTGIGMAPLTTAVEALISGRLKCVKSKPLAVDQIFYLVEAQTPPPANVQIFSDWIRAEMAVMDEELASILV